MKIRRFEEQAPVTLYDNTDFKGESVPVNEGEYNCKDMSEGKRMKKFVDRA
jgi:hypothetical protein